MPVIPTILINGANGIVSGYNTQIHNHDPEEIVDWIKTWIKSPEEAKKLPRLLPWYKGFKGAIGFLEDENTKEVVGWYSSGILNECKQKGKKGRD